MSFQLLLKHFEAYLPLTESEVRLLEGRVSQRQIKRRQAILQEGFPCQHYSFVLEGCFRMFAVDSKGVEHTIQFAAENNWIADIGSFHSGNPSGFLLKPLSHP